MSSTRSPSPVTLSPRTILREGVQGGVLDARSASSVTLRSSVRLRGPRAGRLHHAQVLGERPLRSKQHTDSDPRCDTHPGTPS